MKIRPKTFECALELVQCGYQLFEDNENSSEAIVRASSNGMRVIEIWWPYSDSVWRNTVSDTQAWQNDPNWYFKEPQK